MDTTPYREKRNEYRVDKQNEFSTANDIFLRLFKTNELQKFTTFCFVTHH